MLERLINLPLRLVGKAAKAVQQSESQRIAKLDPPPSARSSASLRVGSPMDVPEDFVLGDLEVSVDKVIALRDAGRIISVIDVRTATEHTRGRPEGALHMPDERVVDDIAEIPAGAVIIVIGERKSAHATRVASFVRFRGLEETYILDGGYSAWKQAGLPVTQG